MTTHHDLDRQLTAWLAEDRPARAPEGLFEAAAARVTTTRRRPGWVIADRWTWRRVRTDGSSARTIRLVGPWSPTQRQIGLLLLVALLIAAFVGVIAIAGGLRRTDRLPAGRGTFRPVAPMAFVREAATATTLRDGRVLVVGGWPDVASDYSPEGGSFQAGARSAEIWDPATETFTRTGDLTTGRWSHSAVLLRDGRVLVVGGFSAGPVDQATATQFNGATPTAEIWDPATGRFQPAGALLLPVVGASAWLEPDGRVRVLGVPNDPAGNGTGGPLVAQIWDPGTTTFALAAATGENMPGIDLGGGRRLWADGLSALIWDPAKRTLQPAPLPSFATKTILPDGRVLVAGGAGDVDVRDVRRQAKALSGCGPAAQLWDPVTNILNATGSLGTWRGHHAAAVLPDGRVLVVGNYWTCDNPWGAEIFELR